MAVSPARLAAYRILSTVNAGQADLPQAIARQRPSLDDERDQALAAEIATGTLRWRAALDHVIESYAKRSLDRLDPEVREILRLSAYQLLHLDRVPQSAVVNDAVQLTGRVNKQSARGFVNAVLRTVSRNRHRLPLPADPADFVRPGHPEETRLAMLDYISTTLSHPRWLAARWLARYGDEAARAWAEFDNVPAPLTLRANLLKTTPSALAAALARFDVQTQAGMYAPSALLVTRGNPYRTPLADSGLFVAQDEASQLVALVAGVRPGERVLDTCASPGGKATAMAAEMGDQGLIVASDRRPKRIALLRQAVRTSGAQSIRVAQVDLLQPLPFQARFDCVVVDAPCSGLGTLRRDPEIRWRRSEEDLAEFAATQRVMLEHAAGVVGVGGRLVYSTCSSEPDENEEVVAAFLEHHPDFAAIDPRAAGLPHGPSLARVIDEAGHLRTYPHLHGLEAFFAALLARRA
jgi:16S rRNA (cytosine967-C5)-methyltransferase